MAIIRKIQKFSTASYVVIIPRTFMELFNLKRGDEMQFTLRDNEIIMTVVEKGGVSKC
ncbi:MAG: AbrB/MazE/SpoVT family DNA-binding domain-containing protein [Candidatus Methanoperedens sp.]|nr:AbrB/MazE/SpoVT family DNA-binding domain-containing protein [Candidatus Methanoperedens sp.]